MITPLKFNNTDDYTHMTVLQTEGVYSPTRIQADTLPDGFYRYELSRGHNTGFSAIQATRAVPYAGDFITKNPLPIDEKKRHPLKDGDWSLHQARPFDFEAFWGQKLSFEKLVSNAEDKHSQLMGKDPNARDIHQLKNAQAVQMI